MGRQSNVPQKQVRVASRKYKDGTPARCLTKSLSPGPRSLEILDALAAIFSGALEQRMSYRESPYLLELVVSLCALPLVAAYRLEGGGVGAPETLAWITLCWALLGAARVRRTIRRRHAGRSLSA